MVAEQQLRPAQEEILKYEGGRLGISAVPGSGKTFTLSRLAAKLVQKLVASGPVDDREVLVVTFTNAAAENFRSSIRRIVESRRLLPSGFRVGTIHSLAHDIVRERPGLVGLGEDFDIIDERTGQEIKRQAVNNYIQANPDFLGGYIKPENLRSSRNLERQLNQTAQEVAEAVVRRVKELRADADALETLLQQQSGVWPLLSFGLQVCRDYERGLSVRGGVDFDDLILLALEALENDEELLARLQRRWPFVLEDEAQDSSALQEKMLSLLTAAHGNWVRVGDPNQAINTTFTSADPRFLKQFVDGETVANLPLPNSGRSALPIIRLANRLIDWSSEEHPLLPPDKALSLPHIQPTEEDDPQRNPDPGDPAVYFYDRPLVPVDEIRILVASLQRWLQKNAQKTVAVLVPDNRRGAEFSKAFEEASLPFDDSLLRSPSTTRIAIDALVKSMRYISQPSNPSHLRLLWNEVWWERRSCLHVRSDTGEESAPDGAEEGSPSWIPVPSDSVENTQESELPRPAFLFGQALGKLRLPERFIYPAAGDDWLRELRWLDDYDGFRPVVHQFRQDLRRWCSAAILPVDELVLTLGQDLFTEADERALAHSAAILLANRARERPDLRLLELTKELDETAANRRRLLGFTEETRGFEPPAGKVTIATMHSAKGLEWDRVHLASVSNYSFPGGGDDEYYRGEPNYIRDSLNLTEEALEQTRQLHMGTLDEYVPGEATREARREYAAERLRLLYVGITRARQELVLTYNTGRFHDRRPNEPALAFKELNQSWRTGPNRNGKKGQASRVTSP
ncbi:MAG: ATP-dependent helicase [Caldilineaceae bacterium]|nr:ATP-dependent helicase [Caldilineaceae bacterium]MDE0337307.1 ATP-dependent helicase [Caldilineaceae bacterium]